jgi:hypothetical protein
VQASLQQKALGWRQFLPKCPFGFQCHFELCSLC